MTLTTDTTKVDVPLGISWLTDIVAYPDGVAVDAAGNVYVTDWGHGVVELARPNTLRRSRIRYTKAVVPQPNPDHPNNPEYSDQHSPCHVLKRSARYVPGGSCGGPPPPPNK